MHGAQLFARSNNAAQPNLTGFRSVRFSGFDFYGIKTAELFNGFAGRYRSVCESFLFETLPNDYDLWF